MGRDDFALNKDVICRNVELVRIRIRAALARSGNSRPPRLVAVTKEATVEQVRLAQAAGVSDFGENRVQDAEERVRSINNANWHFIGHLQRNKVRSVAGRFGLIHSLDSLRLAERIATVATEQGLVVPVLLEVNVSGEASKQGVSPDDALPLLREVRSLKGLTVRGLMTIAPWSHDPELSRPYFSALRLLRDRLLSDLPGSDLGELSMGMTDDFEVAVEEGATIVRVGRAIFGERQGAT